MGGLDLSTTLSIFGLRAELCYQSDRSFAQWYLNSTSSPYVSAAFALDTFWNGHLFAVEGRYHHFLDNPSQAWLTASQGGSLVFFSQLQLPEQSTLRIISQYDIALTDLFFQFRLAYPLRDDLEIALTGGIFEGKKDDNWLRQTGGIFGNWQNQDHLIAQLQWSP